MDAADDHGDGAWEEGNGGTRAAEARGLAAP